MRHTIIKQCQRNGKIMHKAKVNINSVENNKITNEISNTTQGSKEPTIKKITKDKKQ